MYNVGLAHVSGYLTIWMCLNLQSALIDGGDDWYTDLRHTTVVEPRFSPVESGLTKCFKSFRSSPISVARGWVSSHIETRALAPLLQINRPLSSPLNPREGGHLPKDSLFSRTVRSVSQRSRKLDYSAIYGKVESKQPEFKPQPKSAGVYVAGSLGGLKWKSLD